MQALANICTWIFAWFIFLGMNFILNLGPDKLNKK